MLTDYHCHILPAFDDGAKNTEISLQMLTLLKEQGVERAVLTPHFYAHREKSVAHYLERRNAAFEHLKQKPLPLEHLLPGAEVALERGISELPDLQKLAIEGTRLILLELPYSGYADWMSEEIHNVTCESGLTPVIAHVHRCTEWYSKAQMDTILSMDAIFQMNNEVLGTMKGRAFVKRLLKSGKSIVFGSDAHNLDSRRPNFDLLHKKMNAAVIAASDDILAAYSEQ